MHATANDAGHRICNIQPRAFVYLNGYRELKSKTNSEENFGHGSIIESWAEGNWRRARKDWALRSVDHPSKVWSAELRLLSKVKGGEA
ncbi:predicted protein [Histoplasma mississippiense (nom. inval.)]|uniref:predicted protein n=1 Tax=Ajellomyces capsulatus (strain NAm1 / WU24) TaxID=2059318 RepID=UPI000157D05D|nr:predicted protein [Histoplasma mississippiense (nom. inval.)]EDN11236.1 predicted protein [Histoplasma mississippiense (nom. inval.)]